MTRGKRNKQREVRFKEFTETWYYLIDELYDIEEYPSKMFKIKTKKYGMLDYYPKSDKIYFCGRNWKSFGLEWIKQNLLKSTI